MTERCRKFSETIKRVRKERGLSQQELANIIGVKKTSISNYETGYSTPNFKLVHKMAELLELPLSYFLDTDEAQSLLTKKEIQPFNGKTIPYYAASNIEGILKQSFAYRNSIINLPDTMIKRRYSHIAVSVPDSSMNKCGLKYNDTVVINTELKPQNNHMIAAVRNDTFILRRYKKDELGEYLMLESTRVPQRDSYEMLPDPSLIVIGTVVKLIIDYENTLL